MNKSSMNINMYTYQLLFKDYEKIKEEGNFEYLKAYYTIDSFTMNDENNLKIELLECMYNVPIVKLEKIKFNTRTNSYEYKDNNIVVSFNKISDYITDNKLKKELLSKDRYCKCHSYALYFGPKIKNSKIVTGYIILKDRRVLHTVIECNIDGIEYILDFTKNMKITKDQYLKLTNFKVITTFNSNCIKEDLKILSNIDMSIKTYVVFRNEIIDELKRNINKNKLKIKNK